MTVTNLIKYIKSSLNVGKDYTVALSDDEIKIYLELVMSRDFPSLISLDDIKNEHVYAIALLTRKELYYFCATRKAEDFDVEADDATAKREQVFKHYHALIKSVDDEYNKFIADGGAGGAGNKLTSVDVLLPERFYTARNYMLTNRPEVQLNADTIGISMCEISWDFSCNRFFSIRLYIHSTQIYDEYTDTVTGDATLLNTYYDSHDVKARINGLTPDTPYHVAIVVIDQTALIGVSEIVIKTLKE